MSKLVRMISAEGDLTVIAADTTDIVAAEVTAEQENLCLHHE